MEYNEKTQVDFYLDSEKDDDRPIFISGHFNHWKEGDLDYRMQKIGMGKYHLRKHFSAGAFPLRYKYQKGGRDQEELDRWGNPTSVRILNKGVSKTEDYTYRWKLNGLAADTQLLPQKFIIEDDFEIPQLKKRRRVWALVPCDYYQTKKRYPVLYLQDAQNLFDERAPFGNWGIDQKMAILKELGYGDLIIIAIEHGGKDRIKEYSPFETEQFGEGEGDLYARFIVETLKPYVDKKFRSEPHRINTGIGGSSMGGLISTYTAMHYPEVFSKWMIFSPSLWLSNKIFTKADSFKYNDPTFVYLYGGKEESESMESDLRKMSAILDDKSLLHNMEYNLSIHPHATHNEHWWGAEFPKAVKWLFFD